jgi:sarcosine oxidase subunit gamma
MSSAAQPDAPSHASERSLLGSAELTVNSVPAAARFALRCDPAAVKILSESFGLPLPVVQGQFTVAEPLAALQLGPDEWLLLAADGSQPAIATAFASAASRSPFSLVDVSHRYVAMDVKGDCAADALSLGCPLDLHESVFPVGHCTRTVFGKTEIVLWRVMNNPPRGWSLLCRLCAEVAGSCWRRITVGGYVRLMIVLV